MIAYVTSEQPIQARYVRDYMNGNTQNVSGHWVEIEVFDENGANVALNKTVTVTQGNWPTGYESNLSRVTDGIKDVNSWLGSSDGGCEVQIDLGSVYSIKKIVAYHYWADGRRYKDEHCRVSVDGSDWVTVFQVSGNGAVETSSGITLYDFKNEEEVSDVKMGDSQIQSVMLGTKEIWSNFKVPYYRRMDFSSSNHYSMSCSFDTNDLARIVVTKFVVCSTTRRMQGDSYVDAGCKTQKGTSWSKGSWFNNGTRTESGTLDGIAYTLTGYSADNVGRYTMEFAKPIKLSTITGGCGSGVGQWRETDKMYIEVTGLSKE